MHFEQNKHLIMRSINHEQLVDAKSVFVRCVELLIEKFRRIRWIMSGRVTRFGGGDREHYFKGHSKNMTRGGERWRQTFRVAWPENLGDRSLLLKLSLKARSEGMKETMNLDAFKLKHPFLMLIAFRQKTRTRFRWLIFGPRKIQYLLKPFFVTEKKYFCLLTFVELIKNSLSFCDHFRPPGNCHVRHPGSCFGNQKRNRFFQSLAKVWSRKLVCDL